MVETIGFAGEFTSGQWCDDGPGWDENPGVPLGAAAPQTPQEYTEGNSLMVRWFRIHPDV